MGFANEGGGREGFEDTENDVINVRDVRDCKD